MDLFSIILLGLLGMMIGVSGIFVGTGAGIMLVAVMITTLQGLGFGTYDTVRLIIANSVIVLFAMHLPVFIRRWTLGLFSIRASLIVAIPAIIMALIVAYLVNSYELISLNIYKIIFVFFTLYVSIYLVMSRERGVFEVCNRGGLRGNIRNLVAGSLAGFFTSLIGAESATFIVPILNRYCDIDIRKAVNIYNAALFLVLCAMVAFYIIYLPAKSTDQQGLYSFFYLPISLPIAIGAMLSSLLGFSLFRQFKFQYFVYPMVFFFAIFALRILFADILFPLYNS